MQTEPAPAIVRYVPVDEMAAALLGAPPHLELAIPASRIPERGEDEDLPPIRNFHAVSGIVRAIDDGPHFDSPGWTRIVRSKVAGRRHVGARVLAYPWLEDLASVADKPLSGKVGKASNIAGGIALYRIAHPEHPEELWADLYRRLFRGALQPKDPAEAFRAEFFRQADKGAEPERDDRATTKLQVGSTIRLMQAMTAARPKAHPIGRPFYTLDEPFPTP
ncbi:hypothetical protein [Streptomyces virginiae]|uniref:hypothetical protein n=1 Tax=Streptomyces virginiae TaxID=1961 RepID=UPI00364D2C94